jgi:hypothetical protein
MPRPCNGYDITLVNGPCAPPPTGQTPWCFDCTAPFDPRGLPLSIQLDFGMFKPTVTIPSPTPVPDAWGVRHYTFPPGVTMTLNGITIGGCYVPNGTGKTYLIPVPGVPGLCYKIAMGYNYSTPSNPSGCPPVIDICTVPCGQKCCDTCTYRVRINAPMADFPITLKTRYSNDSVITTIFTAPGTYCIDRLPGLKVYGYFIGVANYDTTRPDGGYIDIDTNSSTVGHQEEVTCVGGFGDGPPNYHNWQTKSYVDSCGIYRLDIWRDGGGYDLSSVGEMLRPSQMYGAILLKSKE